MRILSKALVVGISGLALASTALAGTGIQPLTTRRVASGIAGSPLYVCSPPGDFHRLFVVTQSGHIRIVKDGVLLATDFLNWSTHVAFGGEQGLLGMAFDPDYANNGFFYIYYNPSTVAIRFSRFTVSGNPDVANSASEQIVITIPHSGATNHNGGGLNFGPDGFLYAGTGDGGGGCNQFGNAQNGASLLGKMLRLDVHNDAFPADPNTNYAIPPGNPFVGAPNDPSNTIRDEIWDFGMRNPFRWSFDRLTGEMWIGDVGQNLIEEVDHENPGDGGRNYGWACFEGNTAGTCSGQTCNGMPLTFPVQTYTHSFGCAITGGYVYRGCAMPDLQGTYFYSDYCSARIWTFGWNGTSITNFTERTSELAPGGGLAINTVTSFGEDAYGEIYIVDQGGEIFKIVPQTNPPDCNGNGIADVCDILVGTSQDVDMNGVPDECENPCLTGNVNASVGPVTKVLTVNGSVGDVNGHVTVRTNVAITIVLGASPAGPNPASYALWVHRNQGPNPQTLVVGADTLGCTIDPSPFNVGVAPQPYRCLRGGLGPEYCSGVTMLNAPSAAPWTRVRPQGFTVPQTFTLQGVIQDVNAANPSGKSVTNAITLQIVP
jgi:glucose/arabinose dehydrogenase